MAKQMAPISWPKQPSLDYGTLNGCVLTNRHKAVMCGADPNANVIGRASPALSLSLLGRQSSVTVPNIERVVGLQARHFQQSHTETYIGHGLLEAYLREGIETEHRLRRFNPARGCCVAAWQTEGGPKKETGEDTLIFAVNSIDPALIVSKVTGEGRAIRVAHLELDYDPLQLATGFQANYAPGLLAVRYPAQCCAYACTSSSPQPIIAAQVNCENRCAAMTVSPFIPEMLLVDENGRLALCSLADSARVQTIGQCLKQRDESIAAQDAWWGLGFTDHPREILVADSHTAALFDMRSPSPATTLLQCHTEVFCALESHWTAGCQWASSTNQSVFLSDTRMPGQPVIQWQHNSTNDPPVCLAMRNTGHTQVYAGLRNSRHVITWTSEKVAVNQSELWPSFLNLSGSCAEGPVSGTRFPLLVKRTKKELRGILLANERVWAADLLGCLVSHPIGTLSPTDQKKSHCDEPANQETSEDARYDDWLDSTANREESYKPFCDSPALSAKIITYNANMVKLYRNARKKKALDDKSPLQFVHARKPVDQFPYLVCEATAKYQQEKKKFKLSFTDWLDNPTKDTLSNALTAIYDDNDELLQDDMQPPDVSNLIGQLWQRWSANQTDVVEKAVEKQEPVEQRPSILQSTNQRKRSNMLGKKKQKCTALGAKSRGRAAGF